MAKPLTMEERLRATEDRLNIYDLIASHPPSADTGSDNYYRDAFATNAVVDLGDKQATGREAISQVVKTPGHQAAIAGGLAHFCGLPRVELHGDTAIATSYLQIIVPDAHATEQDIPNHGVSRGFRIHRISANRWQFARTPQGWKVTRRTLRPLDGTPGWRDILRQGVAQIGAAQQT